MPSMSDVAIVIPVGLGDVSWRGLIPLLRDMPSSTQVVMSMTLDDDQSLAELDHRVRIVRGARGRSAQQNAGAAVTDRPWLWFLHADSRFEPAALRAIEALHDPRALAYFKLRFRDGGPAMRVNAWGAWIRSSLLRLPFGDQGFLLQREAFDALGQFDTGVKSGEDHALVWAARRARMNLVALPAPLTTSARRYTEHGWLRTTTTHLALTWSQARHFSAAKR